MTKREDRRSVLLGATVIVVLVSASLVLGGLLPVGATGCDNKLGPEWTLVESGSNVKLIARPPAGTWNIAVDVKNVDCSDDDGKLTFSGDGFSGGSLVKLGTDGGVQIRSNDEVSQQTDWVGIPVHVSVSGKHMSVAVLAKGVEPKEVPPPDTTTTTTTSTSTTTTTLLQTTTTLPWTTTTAPHKEECVNPPDRGPEWTKFRGGQTKTLELKIPTAGTWDLVGHVESRNCSPDKGSISFVSDEFAGGGDFDMVMGEFVQFPLGEDVVTTGSELLSFTTSTEGRMSVIVIVKAVPVAPPTTTTTSTSTTTTTAPPETTTTAPLETTTTTVADTTTTVESTTITTAPPDTTTTTAATESTLPFTGIDTWLLVAIAVVLLLLGTNLFGWSWAVSLNEKLRGRGKE